MSELPPEYRHALEQAALFDVSDRGKVELTGADAIRFLHNLSTNDILHVPVGSGCEAFLTTAQARVVAHLLVYHLQLADKRDALWLEVAPGQAERVIKHLDHFLISEQVEFADRTTEFAQFYLAGPLAKPVLDRAVQEAVPELAEFEHVTRRFVSGVTCRVCRHTPLALPGYDIVCPRADADSVRESLLQTGALPAGRETYEVLRVEGGTPEYGVDIDEARLVMDVNRTAQAICYTKGCFLGQEPIVMARDRGQVNRALLGVKLAKGVVPPGTRLFRQAQEVGQVTSSVFSPGLASAIALAYVRRGHQEAGTELEAEAQGVRQRAVVAALPFRGPKAVSRG